MLAYSVALFAIVAFCPFCDSSDKSQCESTHDSFDDTGLGLLQRSAQFKLHQKSSASHDPLNLTLAIGRRFTGGCACTSHFCDKRLLTPSAHFHLEASIRFGILSSTLSHCAEHNKSRGQAALSLAEVGQVPPVSQHQELLNNSIAGMSILMTWVFFSICAICTCLFGVASAPLLHNSKCQKVKSSLVDEISAWNRGFGHWLSMSWMDSLIGLYGKQDNASQIDPSGFCPPQDCEEPEECAQVRKAWDAEIKEKGLFGASICGMIYRVVGTRTCVCLIACAWAVALIEYIGMVIALDIILAHLSHVQSATEPDSSFVVHPLRQLSVVIGTLFVLPLTHRCCNVLLIMMDGYSTRLLSIGIGCLIHEKSLRLPIGSAYNAVDRGEENKRPSIAQLLSMDIMNEGACMFKTVALLSATPFIVIILLVYLVVQMRLAGLMSMLVLLPCLLGMLASMRGALLSRARYQTSQDSRLHSLLELFRRFRFAKPLGHEGDLLRKINQSRRQELEASQMHIVNISFSSANVHITIWCIAVGSLFLHLVLYGSMDAQHMWIVFQIIASLQACTSFISVGSSKLLHLPNSFSRIANFLKQSERPSDVARTDHNEDSELKIRGSFTFEDCSEPVLHNIDASFSKGELVFIVGAAASGKSAFLQAALGELYSVGHAHVVAPCGVGYISQSPWLLNGTLQENVLMGQSFEQRQYQRALEVSGLASLWKTSLHDQILLGSSHLQLSEIDSIRVALARAVYAESRRVLLVDASDEVSQALLKDTLMNTKWKDSTRIIVMPANSHLLPCADRVVLLEAGRVVFDGPPDDILSDSTFQKLAAACTPAATSDAVQENNDPRLHSSICEAPIAILSGLSKEGDTSADTVQTRMQSSPMQQWLCAGGSWRFTLVMVFMMLQGIVQLCEFLRLASWANDAEVTASCRHGFYASSILMLALSSGALLCTSEWLGSHFGNNASEQIHTRALASILRRPLAMLSMGSLINHFSRDMAKVDCLAATICFKMIRILYGMLLQQAYVMSMVPYSLALCASPLYFAMAYFGSRYHCAVTHLLNSVSQSLSSLHDMLGCNLEAQLSIRSSAFRRSVISKHRRHLCFAAQANYLFAAPLKAWLTLRVTLCTSVLVTGFVLYATLAIDTVGVGTLGLIVSLFFAFLTDFEVLADLISQSIVTAGAMQRVLLMSENRHERDVRDESKQDQGDIAEKALQVQKSYARF